MKIENITIATSIEELTEIIHKAKVLEGIEGRINLTVNENGDVEYWQPSNQPIAESVTPAHVALERRPSCDEYEEEQPSDIL